MSSARSDSSPGDESPPDAFASVARAAAEQLAAVFRRSPVPMILSILADGRIAKANDAFLKMYGLTREEMIGRSSAELGLLVDRNRRDEIAAAARSDELIHTFEIDVRTRQGEPRRALLWTEAIIVAGQECLLTQMYDITETVPARWHGMDMAELLTATIDSVAEGIVVQDAHGEIVIANPAAERLLGMSADQMRGRTALDPFWRATREDGSPFPLDEHPTEVTLRTGEPQTDVVMVVHTKERPPTWMSVTTRPLPRSPNGESTGVVASFFDLTERVRASTELAERQRAVNLLKDEFVATVSHELRTPLTAISGFAELLLEDGELPAGAARSIAIVQESAQRLTTLINDLLEVSRVEAGAVGLDLQRVEVVPALQRAADAFAPLVEAKRQTLTVEASADLPPAAADPKRLAQILVNLLSNAHHYTPAGGSITVSARAEDDWVRVSVSDTGIGLAPEEHERIFDRFYRASGRTGGGTGLGLAITRSLVELHGGVIEVVSAPGAGSTFTFTLPIDKSVLSTQ